MEDKFSLDMDSEFYFEINYEEVRARNNRIFAKRCNWYYTLLVVYIVLMFIGMLGMVISQSWFGVVVAIISLGLLFAHGAIVSRILLSCPHCNTFVGYSIRYGNRCPSYGNSMG